MTFKSLIVSPEAPVFVCERCGNILRLIYSDEQDEAQCDFCGTIMTKTVYALDDYDGSLMYMKSREARIFQRNVFQGYVSRSKMYDENLHR
ncbi:MAG: hypothetical protein K2N29_01775, partial [Ruminiclostridium sp.]|nr:hypothetical protein [Ruminiclostridium sp.]